MSADLIRAAFESRLKTWADAQSAAMPIAFDNVELVPQPEGRYLRANLLPAATFAEDLQRVHKRFGGIFQISVCMPTNTGAGAAQDIVNALDALFPAATPLVQGGLRIFITDPLSQGPGINEPDRYVVPCSLPYRADSIT